MARTHLRRNKDETTSPVAACASNPYVNKAHRNGRDTYQFMASEIVPWSVFKTLNHATLCQHCMESALIIRNRQRKVKGQSPIAVWNEGC